VYFAEVLLTMPFLLLLTASQLFDLTHSVLSILNNTYSAVTIYIRSPIVLLSCFFRSSSHRARCHNIFIYTCQW